MTVLARAVLCVVALCFFMLADGQENADGTEPASVSLPCTDVCGKRGSRFKRIVEGSDARPGMFPWIAALGYRSSEDSSIHWRCDGSLVTDRHLITSALGVVNGTYVLSIVRLGVLDLNATEPTKTEADYEVDTLTVHPGFKSTASEIINNIGIIKLKKKVTFSNFIQPICLPQLSEFRMKNFTGSTGYIAGWGHKEWGGRRATRLQQAQVRVWDQEKCKKVYEGQKRAVVDNKVVCAIGDDGSDTCEGDGTLMMPYGPDSNYYLYGVASYGMFCGDPFKPAVYTRVSEYMDWILLNLK